MKTIEQQNLFDEAATKSVTIVDAATRTAVTTATIRNWIKTGYLKPTGRGRVTLRSLERFELEVSGKEKLTHRANKSQKDLHDHEQTVSVILKELAIGNVNSEEIGSIYESSLSDSYRNKEGIYYTPKEIVDDLFSLPQRNVGNSTFCDPCCGSGNFVLRALELGFRPENIYAFDIDPVAIEITEKRIFENTGIRSKNIEEGDFLDAATTHQSEKFDFIFTNPPWGKKISKVERSKLGGYLNAGTSLDTSSLFFFACLNSLTDDGQLGLLLPEAFFNISSYEAARTYALKHSIARLIDYGKPFKGLVTRAQAVVLEKSSSVDERPVNCEVDGKISRRRPSSFSANPKSILNLQCTRQDAAVVSHIFSVPHITLQGQAKWGLGIVTGSNRKFIKKQHEPGLIPVYKGADISGDGLRDPSSYIPADLSLYQQVAPVELYESPQKLIYKFISSKLCFFHDKEQKYILNSANMVIPNDDFPVSLRVLTDVLSCDLMNWVFARIFNTHKVLRGDLECLPVHSQFLNGERFNYRVYLSKLSIEERSDGTFRVAK